MSAHVELDGVSYYTLLEQPSVTGGNGKVVLLCHAIMNNLHMWDSTVKVLHNLGYTTLRFDHIGHGSTTVPAEENASIHIDDITRHMHQLVERVTGSSKVKAVIGCSIGGVLVLRYAMLYPDDVEQVISIAAPGVAAPEAAKNLWGQRIVQFEQDTKSGGTKLCLVTVNRWIPGESAEDEGVRQEALRQVKTCSLRGYKILVDAVRNYDYAEEVRKIKAVECLIVAGSEDSAVSPGMLKDLSSKIPHARYVKVEGAGHLPPMHKTADFNAITASFLEKWRWK